MTELEKKQQLIGEMVMIACFGVLDGSDNAKMFNDLRAQIVDSRCEAREWKKAYGIAVRDYNKLLKKIEKAGV